MQEKKRKEIKVGQSDVKLNPFVLPCSRAPLVQAGVYCLPYSRWALVGLCIVDVWVNYKRSSQCYDNGQNSYECNNHKLPPRNL